MKYSISTSISIKGTQETIKNTLMDFNSYQEWNPFIRSINGIPEVDNTIQVEFDSMKFSPKVVENSSTKFSWLGHFIIPGIFDSHHQFEIIDYGNGTCTLIHSENFKGILVPFMKKKLNTEIKASFINMNKALKKRIEL